jgi:hypothetical protein
VARLTVVSLVLALAAFLLVFELLRRRRLREKYAVIWVLIVIGTVVLAFVPSLLTRLASLIGIQTPSNLLFLISLVTLFAVSLQLSGEVGALEEQTRRLAEEVGALRLRLEERLDDPSDHDPADPVPPRLEAPDPDAPSRPRP